MILSNNIENIHSNLLESIKNCKNKEEKKILIGSLIADLGKRTISKVAKACNCSWRFAKECFLLFTGELPVNHNCETRGRKKITDKFPNLKKDIEVIIENDISTDPRFKTEKQYVRLTLKEIIERLIKTGKYTENDIKKSTLANLLNEMGYKLKKVQKIKPLKKIKETDAIFENVKNEKDKAFKEEKTVLISIDTKDKILIGPYSRSGKNRNEIKAVDHELTNNCLVPFGILDIKNNKPYFFNFINKPTSLDLVDCIEDFWNEQYKNSNAIRLAILLDNGPDNSGVRTAFLKGLIEFSKRANIIIELIYYPPYHSKYNPIERLWARIENIWNGYLLENINICMNFMSNLTWKGIPSVTKLKEVKYEKGLIIDKKEMKELEKYYITRNPKLKKWSILISP